MDLERLLDEQRRLNSKIILEDRFSRIDYVAGVDSSYINDKIITAAVLVDYPSRAILKREYVTDKIDFPYIPGLLFYREGKNTIKAIDKLKPRPDIILIDGGGINHPRKIGSASHVGVILEKTTIGVTKKMFYGSCIDPTEVGESSPIILDDMVIGYAYKPKNRTNPIYITPGNRISVDSAFEVTKNLISKYKLPIPIQEAHNFAKSIKLSFKESTKEV